MLCVLILVVRNKKTICTSAAFICCHDCMVFGCTSSTAIIDSQIPLLKFFLVHLTQPLWQGVLDSTSMTRCTWYNLCWKVYLIWSRCTWYNLYGKVYLIQPLWQGVLDTTSMARCIWYNLYRKMCLIPLWQGVLDTTSMARCTQLNLYGKVYLIQPLWQCVPDTTSMVRSISPRNKISVYPLTFLCSGTCTLYLIEIHVLSIL